MKNKIKYFFRIVSDNLELIMWSTALVYLFFINPYEINHFSLCAFNQLGIDFCPGCGIGRSISMIYKGDFLGSFNMHPLGLIALAILLYRIITLTLRNKLNLKRG